MNIFKKYTATPVIDYSSTFPRSSVISAEEALNNDLIANPHWKLIQFQVNQSGDSIYANIEVTSIEIIKAEEMHSPASAYAYDNISYNQSECSEAESSAYELRG